MQERMAVTITRQDVVDLLSGIRTDLATRYHVRRIGLFGSVGRNQNSEKSDIDILIDFETGFSTMRNYMNLQRYLQGIFPRKIDLVTYGSLSPYIKTGIDHEVLWIGER